jgi:hypothetical protein
LMFAPSSMVCYPVPVTVMQASFSAPPAGGFMPCPMFASVGGVPALVHPVSVTVSSLANNISWPAPVTPSTPGTASPLANNISCPASVTPMAPGPLTANFSGVAAGYQVSSQSKPTPNIPTAPGSLGASTVDSKFTIFVLIHVVKFAYKRELQALGTVISVNSNPAKRGHPVK